MDIRGKIEELAEKIKTDDALQKKFTKDPMAAVEELLGVSLPADQLKPLVEGIKAKLTLSSVSSLFKTK